MKINNVHFKGYDLLLSRLDDLSYQCEKHRKTTSTNFLNEGELEVARRYLGNNYSYRIDGGYSNAQRGKVVFLFDEDDFFSDIVCLYAKINTQFVKITHRDVLGALMALNIEREQIGDIFVDEDKIVIYANETMATYIIANLDQIHHLKVHFDISDEVYEPVIKFKSFKTTVSSERLDVLVSAMCNLNRKDAQNLIASKAVMLNHMTIEESSKLCNNNCTISVRGYGRFIYDGVIKSTKKDRLLIEYRKYI